MPINLKNKSFITLKDFSRKEIFYLLDLAHSLKKTKYAGNEQQMSYLAANIQ